MATAWRECLECANGRDVLCRRIGDGNETPSWVCPAHYAKARERQAATDRGVVPDSKERSRAPGSSFTFTERQQAADSKARARKASAFLCILSSDEDAVIRPADCCVRCLEKRLGDNARILVEYPLSEDKLERWRSERLVRMVAVRRCACVRQQATGHGDSV